MIGTGTGSAGLLMNESHCVTAEQDNVTETNLQSRSDFHSVVDRHFQCRFRFADAALDMFSLFG